MPKGVAIPEALADAVLHLIVADFSPTRITHFTGVSQRQQAQILSLWCQTGRTVKPKGSVNLKGRPCNLSTEEAYVSFTLFLQS